MKHPKMSGQIMWTSGLELFILECDLLLNPSPYSKDDLLNYKSLDCYINFTNGWVREILVKTFENKRVVISKVSSCIAS